MDTSNSQDEYYSDMDESFSFTCCDFDDDDEDDNNNDDDESYIEIALEPLPTEDDDDLKLRVSFSSRVPLKELLVDQVSTRKVLLSSDASSSSSLSSSSSKTRGPELISSGVSGTNPKSISTRKVQFSAINRVLNALVSGFRAPSSEETGLIDENRRLASSESRKASKVTTAINGSITKILIKFRSIKIRPMLTSFAKPRQVKGNKGKSQEMNSTIWIHRKQINPLDNRTVGKGRGDYRRKKPKSSVGMDINTEAIKGVLEAISSISIGGRSKQTKTKTKSCPGSMKCSPINERGVADRESRGYSRENSVQAAIAHCKRSFGQAQEFGF